MNPRFRLIFTAALTLLVLAGTDSPRAAADSAGQASASVKRANRTISKLLAADAPADSKKEKRLASRIRSSVRDFLDVDELGRRAMGKHWNDLSDAQKESFLAGLRTLIERNYIRGLRANLDYDVVYLGEKGNGNERLVLTEIRTKSGKRRRTLSIDYKVRREEGSWRAYDVVTDGVGLVENYRAQFGRILAKEGFDGLMRRMKAKIEELEQDS